MPNVQMRRLIVAITSIGYIFLTIGLCSSQISVDQLNLPILCQETDAPLIFQEEGSPICWKCECFDDVHWGCFRGSGNCSNAVSPTVDFGICPNSACDDSGICFPYGTGDLWINQNNELCWCDDGDSKCNIDSSLAANETNKYRNVVDYRNSGIVCVKDERLLLNFGDAILTNCSICLCINGSFWCSELEECGKEFPEFVCPLVVGEGCPWPIIELCTNDSQCTGNTKCCRYGCAQQCLEAVSAGSVTKPGTCPDLQVGPPPGLVAQCYTDYDCEDHLKCCNIGSVYVCHEPYNPNDCEDGDGVVPCTFSNPCEHTRCPNHPTARCRISHCGTCHAQYFVDNMRVNCFDDGVCDIDTPMVPCYLDESCSFQFFYQPCPAATEAECRLNYCGSCFYEFFNTTGNKIACYEGDPCPVGIEEHSCDHKCLYGNFCPEAAGANVTCVPSKCGGCGFPKYYYENGTEAQCFNLEDNCPEGSISPSTCNDYCNDPAYSCTNPDVVSCQINYCGGRCTSEYFNANGERVSCYGGRMCPAGQQETPFCSNDCDSSACFAYPNAVCEINACDFRCEKVFYDPVTLTPVNCSEGYTCPEENPFGIFCNEIFSDILFPGCFGMSCSRHPDAKCFESSCGFCHPEFYVGQERVNCYGDIPCPQGIQENAYCEDLCGPTAYCPANLSAICLRKQCNGKCETVFQDLEGNIIEDCFAGIQCPTGEADALCPYNLCERETCETHPEAECRLNHCGICRAQFFLPNGTEITNCSAIGCANDLPPVSCGEDVCRDICPKYPNATCLVNNCGQCTAEFFSPEGTRITAEDCGEIEREGFCPAEFVFSTISCETDTDCVAPLKCCSPIPGVEFFKFCVNSVEVNPYSCEYEGLWYDPHEIRWEECELCTCLLGRWACYGTKCNLTCPVDAPFMSNCNADDCNPTEQLCPAHSEARCTINPCGGCTVEHVDENDTILDCYDPDLLQCPEGESPVTCEFNPCEPTCPAYPDAICRLNVCGACKAEYVFENRIVDCHESPRCFYEGHEYVDFQDFMLSDNECVLCICLSFNRSACFSIGEACADPLPCEENGVEYPPRFARRENCTECICSEIVTGEFSCFDIPNCVDYQKDGVCPPKQGSPNECVEEVIHECSHDGDCNGTYKCCHEYCGSICETPVPEGPTCFSCISYFTDDIPNTEDTCSDVAVPNVDVMKCITGMVCASIRAEAAFQVLGQDPGMTGSINIVQRGCFWPEQVSQNASGCLLGNDTMLPTVYDNTEDWIRQHEQNSIITDFFVSACFCEEYKCNSVIPPVPSATTQTPIIETTSQPVSASTTPEISSTKATSPKTSSPSTSSQATTAQAPMTETTLQTILSTTTQGTTSSKATSPKISSQSTTSQAATTQESMKETTLQPTTMGTTSTQTTTLKTSSPSTASQGNLCILQGKPSEAKSFQSNPCSNCVCTNGFFLCRFNGTCSADAYSSFTSILCSMCSISELSVSVEEVLYTLTGNFADIAEMEKQFGRTLIQNLAKELMIDETVFLDIKLSAGSVKVKQNVTDSKSMDLTAKEVSQQIQEKVNMGTFTFMFNGKSYTSVSDTFEVGQSYQFSSDNSSSMSGAVVTIIIIAAIVGICLLIVVVIVAFRVLRNRKLDAESTVLLRLSRSPSLNSKDIGPVEFENPVYSN